ncbi:hypothetical protein KEJ47_00760 [Candidatus Bathyarchaeota archaeon]|nr:hypothetical protein [Candidatus Bathyarchaeota archaeon]
MTQKLFLNKTGLELFDIFRAFGLGFAIRGISYEDIEVVITDINYAYILDIEGEILNAPDPQLFIEAEPEWKNVFSTFRDRKDAKSRPPKEDVENIIKNEFENIISLHRDIAFIPNIGKNVKEGKTLYQSLDISGAKGFREEKKGNVYHEGTQVKVDKYSWAIGCLGAAITGTWREGNDFKITIVPNPYNISIGSHRQILEEMGQEKLCNISFSTTLAHFAVRLAEKIALRKYSYDMTYDSVVFNLEKKTSQQNKPGGGGKLGLGFLSALIDEDFGTEALKKFDQIFRSGFVKGAKQSLALALTDFLIHPTLDNFRRYEDLNIRGNINEHVLLWDRRELEAIMKHVQIV